jgi:RimJ/RimL family protein N-acetyltransferase
MATCTRASTANDRRTNGRWRLGYFQAFAGIALPNAPSVALHESLGFEPIGIYRNVGHKHGAWHDVMWWQKEIRKPQQPGAPKAFIVRNH